MKERLLAERAAQRASAPIAPAAAPAPAPAKPAASINPAPRASAPLKPSAPARAGSAAAPVSAAAAASERPSSSARAGRGSARGGREKAGARDRGERSGKGGARKGPLPLLLACVGLLAVGGAVWWFLLRAEPADTVQAAPASEQAPVEQAPESAQDAQSAADAPAPSANGVAPVASAKPASEAPVAAAAPAPEPKAAEAVDPASIDLGALPTYERFPGTSDEEWQQIQDWSRTMLDRSAGAAQTRAAKSLEQAGRKAFPAILNAMKSLDLATEDGMQAGKLCQRTMMNICNGTNFDWKDDVDPKSVVFNKKVVQLWASQWERCMTDDPESNAYWAKFSKSEKKKGEQPAEEEAGSALDEI